MFDLKCDEEIRSEVLRKVHERWHAPNASGRVEELHDVLLYEVFAALFIVSDEDQSGDVDVNEFMGCLAKLNKKEVEREYAKILMDEFDVDGSGVSYLLLLFLVPVLLLVLFFFFFSSSCFVLTIASSFFTS